MGLLEHINSVYYSPKSQQEGLLSLAEKFRENNSAKEEIQNKIVKDLVDSLDARGMSKEDIRVIFIQCEEAIKLDTLIEQYKYIKPFVSIDKCYPSVCTYLRNLDRLEHIDDLAIISK